MIDIFNISIYKKNLNLNNKKLLRYILTLKKQSKGRNKSNPTGWQSFDLNLTQPIFSKLNKEITEYFLQYINQILLKNNFKISNMWANVNGYKDYNLMHYHPNAVVSGVYYLKVPENSGNIFFVNPASQLIETSWDECIERYTTQNSPFVKVNPIEGQLILFPSWLQHGVEPNLNKKQNRVSLSFNISKC
jgi:uncharacterized protein (TIGR02466 family)